MRAIKNILIAILMVSTVIFVGCKEKKLDEHGHAADTHAGEESEGEHEELPENIVELDADQIKVADIQLGKVEMRQISGVIKANGIVSTTPQSAASVSVPFGGFIKSSNLLPGVAVKKGQTLAIVENTDFVDLQQNYLEIKNKYEFAEAEYKRHNELYKNDVYSQKNVQQTATEYRNLKAQLKAIGQKLLVIGINPEILTEDAISSSISLKSPISGYIKTANINMGKYVSSSDVLFEIVGIDNLLLELSLFEKDANSVTVGQEAHFSINNETHEHKAKIYQVGKSINADKTYKVYATILQSCPNVMPGMYVLAHIEKTDKQVTTVPSTAVVSFENKYYIFAFEKDKQENGKPFTEYRFVEITKGETNDGYTEIQLPASFDIIKNKIVVKGAYNLLSAKKNAGEMTCG